MKHKHNGELEKKLLQFLSSNSEAACASNDQMTGGVELQESN